jgi:hypothetical protein
MTEHDELFKPLFSGIDGYVVPHPRWWVGILIPIVAVAIVVIATVTVPSAGNTLATVLVIILPPFGYGIVGWYSGIYLHATWHYVAVGAIVATPSAALGLHDYFAYGLDGDPYAGFAMMIMVVYTATSFFLALGYTMKRIKMRVVRRGVCFSCGYSTVGLPSNVCPECGEEQLAS